ncbi:MAG TPA: hypothetical protein PK297_11590 [Spirochaetota bacterium]|nr:hypothetical protein [Spirochaetota bacterium]
MKTHAVCPKCGSGEIAVSGGSGRQGHNVILTGWTYLSAVACEQYICLGCGYVEQYVRESAGLETIAGKLPSHRGSENEA